MIKPKFQIKPYNQIIACLIVIATALTWLTNVFAQPVINEIRFEKISVHEERVLLVMEGFQPPKAFDLPEPIPRLVFDFFDATLQSSIKSATDTEGKLIKKISDGTALVARKKSSPCPRSGYQLRL